MKLNWNFLGGEEVQNKKPSFAGVGGGGMHIFWNYTLVSENDHSYHFVDHEIS